MRSRRTAYHGPGSDHNERHGRRAARPVALGGPRPPGHTMGASGTERFATRYYGCLVLGFYNQRRRHSTIGQISPATYERRAHEEGMDAMENRQERGFPPRPHPSVFSGKEDRRPTQTA